MAGSSGHAGQRGWARYVPGFSRSKACERTPVILAGCLHMERRHRRPLAPSLLEWRGEVSDGAWGDGSNKGS